MSRIMRYPDFLANRFPTKSDVKRAIQQQRMARSLQFRVQEAEGLYNPLSENQLQDYHAAELRLCFRICKKQVAL